MKSVKILIILIAAVLFTCVHERGALAAPLNPIVIENYTGITDFSGHESVLIRKGDDPAWAHPDLNDSDWKVISLPSDWSKFYIGWTGVCWYRMHVKFPDRLPVKTLGIELGVVSDVDELYLNGELIASSGSFPPNRRSAYDRIRIYEIPTTLIKKGGDNLLALRVAGLFRESNGPHMGHYRIAPLTSLQRDLLSREFFNVFFCVIYLAVSFYFGLIFFRHSVDRENLYFSLMTLISSVYFFMRTQIKFFITDDLLLLKRIEYAALFVIMVAFMQFITHYSNRRRMSLHHVFYATTAGSMLFILFSDNIVLWHDLLNYFVQPSWVIPVAYSLYVLINDFRKNFDSIYLLAAYGVMLLTLINDIMVHRLIYSFIRLSGYAYLLLILGLAIIMHNRFITLKRRFDEFEKTLACGDGVPGPVKISRERALTPEAEEKLKEALCVIEQSYADDISRESLADDLGMNPDYLGKLFKQYTGKKISEYINEIRVRKAVKLLDDSENSIPSIAFAVGFESLPTFYRVFQKCTGFSPMAYRKKTSIEK